MGVTILNTLRWISALDIRCSFIEHHFCSHSWASCFLCWKKWSKLIDLMPCVWLLPLTYTIAEFNPNAITHLGDFSSLSSIRFQPVDLNRFNRYLEIEYSTKIPTSTLGICISLCWARGDVHTRDFLTSDQFLMRVGKENLPSHLWSLRTNVRTRALRYNGI